MHEQHLLAVFECIRRHAPANCWQRVEAARIGWLLYFLKLPVSTWGDKHSSGHCCIILNPILMSAPARGWIKRLCGKVEFSKILNS